MVNKKFWFGMLVMVLAFGIMVLGCEEEKSEPYPQSISIRVSGSFFGSELTGGDCSILFITPGLHVDTTYTGTRAKVSVEDLQWLQASDINFEYSNAGDRTVSITSIEKSSLDDKNTTAVVYLKLTRSAAPSEEKATATVLITLPDDFTAKYPDGITWENKTFPF